MTDSSSSLVDTHHLRLHHEHRLLFVETHVIKLTPTEYTIVQCLLDERVVSDDTLAAKALNNQGDITRATRDTLEKHITNLRSKIYPSGLIIYRVHNYGYILAGEGG